MTGRRARLAAAMKRIPFALKAAVFLGALAAATERFGPGRRLRNGVRGLTKGHFPFVAAVVVMALLAGLPLFNLKLMSGHDTLAYLPRHVEFYEGLKAGRLFPRWAADLGASYGEPTFAFNPPLLYYLVAFFHALGSSFIASENMALIALLLVAGVAMYLLAAEFFGRRGGLVSATAYLFAPYVLVNLYVRHDLADFSSFAFIPLAFWGMYRYMLRGGQGHLAVAALSIALLLLSSASTALMTLPAILLFVAWVGYARRSWPAVVRGAWGFALGMGLSAFFWAPAMMEQGFVHFARKSAIFDFHDHFVYLQQLMYSPWGFGASVPGPHDGMSFAIGPVYLAMTLASLLLLRRLWAASKSSGLLSAFFLLVIAGAVFMTTSSSLFLWEHLPILHYLQFPWRFLSLIAVSTAFLCGFPFLLLGPERRRLADILMVLLIGGILLFELPHAKPQMFLNVNESAYSPQNIAAKAIPDNTREFEPVWVRSFPWPPTVNRLSVLEGQAVVDAADVQPFRYRFHVASGQATLRVNTFYYPGWRVWVDGRRQPVDVSNAQGLMDFRIEGGSHIIEVAFQETSWRLLWDWASVGTLALLALYPLVTRLRSFLIDALGRTSRAS